MIYLRMYIKSHKNLLTYEKVVKVDYNSIKVSEEKKGIYKSLVSEERIIIKKKNKLFFHLTKTGKNNKMFMYEYITDLEDIDDAEIIFSSKVEKHFKMFFSLFFKKEMMKIASVCQNLIPREYI